MDVLFLDANVLVSAAWREDARVRGLWGLQNVELVTSAYAVEEAARNLSNADRRARLSDLLKPVRITHEPGPLVRGHVRLPKDVSLPDDDLPILMAAIEAGASHLITGDLRHFGGLFGRERQGLRIRPPAEYLRPRGTS